MLLVGPEPFWLKKERGFYVLGFFFFNIPRPCPPLPPPLEVAFMTSFPFPPAFLALGSRSPRGRAMDRMRLITIILENLECDRGRLKEKEEELILSEEGAILHFLCL